MFREGLVWNREFYNDYLNYLLSLEDKNYKDFNKRIVNTKDKMIGIRVSMLRKIAKDISKTDIKSFLELVTDKYYEEKLIEGIIIGQITGKKTFDWYLYRFIKKIDNWAICDMCVSSFKIMKKDNSYYDVAKSLLKEKDEFIIRVGLIIILDHYVDENHIDDILKQIDNLKSDKYYVNMATSWLLSVCFIKYRNKTLEYLKNNNLDKFTFNKTISKIRDSYRVSVDDKEMLKKMNK